jgi:nucleoside-diphosphate-sugar epimerase
MVNPALHIQSLGSVTDDPQRRRPDITRAGKLLGWAPRFAMRDGLVETAHYFHGRLSHYGSGPAGRIADHVQPNPA